MYRKQRDKLYVLKPTVIVPTSYRFSIRPNVQLWLKIRSRNRCRPATAFGRQADIAADIHKCKSLPRRASANHLGSPGSLIRRNPPQFHLPRRRANFLCPRRYRSGRVRWHQGCGVDRECRRSQRHGFSDNPVTHVRGQGAFGEHIHFQAGQ